MNIVSLPFGNLFLIELKSFKDARGEFVKTIHDETFTASDLDFRFTESFFSVSKKDVMRGMHFQLPPHDHTKLVYVVNGAILDVVVDLRFDSPYFGKFYSVELSAINRKALYIGSGFAHGFLSLETDSVVEYHTTQSQNKVAEAGISFDSFGFEWPVNDPILSERDKSFPRFDRSNRLF
jgi:dTDP-4-dehydrorhamnose 3,5-epimerase